MTLQQDIQNAVQHASSTPILAAAQRLQVDHFPRGCWLDAGNRYGRSTTNKLRMDGNRAPTRPNQFAEYIAASTILHCADGWTFFSHAVDHLISGDISACVFMAYYAQIRAVMSFMACEGIGIFDNKHFWFDGNNKVWCSFGGKTHSIMWTLVEEWASCSTKNTRLLNILSVGNKSFYDWLGAAQVSLRSTAINMLAREWLRSWSIDLKTLSRDRYIREEASYRPHRIYHYSYSNDLEENLKLLVQIWRASEPIGSNRFNLLDFHLLRNTLTTIFRNKTGGYPYWKRNKGRYTKFVSDAVENLGLSIDEYWVKFLSNPDPTINHPILEQAMKEGENKYGSIQALPIVSRAYILLRLASAATQDVLVRSSIGKFDLLFWWEALGNDIGLWLPGNTQEPTDLWADVENSINAIESWYTQNTSLVSVLKIRQDLPFESWQVKQFNRVGLWAIGL